jgi:hypothetical protein
MTSKTRFLNLEIGMPSVDEARRRLIHEIATARRDGIRVIKIVHGYGSSGVGGKLRWALRKSLNQRRAEGIVGRLVFGEQWSIFDSTTTSLLDDYPELRRDRDLDNHNHGVTIAELVSDGDRQCERR